MAHVVDQTTSRPDVVAWGMAHISTASTPTAKSSGGNHVIDGTAAPRPQGGRRTGRPDRRRLLLRARKPNPRRDIGTIRREYSLTVAALSPEAENEIPVIGYRLAPQRCVLAQMLQVRLSSVLQHEGAALPRTYPCLGRPLAFNQDQATSRGEQIHPALQHRMRILECPQHMSSQNDVEGRRSKGRVCCIALHEVDFHSRCPCFRSCQRNHFAGNVDPGDLVGLFGKKDSEASRSTTEIRNPCRLFWKQRSQERLPGGTHLRVAKTVIGFVIEGVRVAIPHPFNI